MRRPVEMGDEEMADDTHNERHETQMEDGEQIPENN